MNKDFQLSQITIKNFMGIGIEAQTLTINPLVVLVGKNNAGKSTFFRAFRFLKAACRSQIEDAAAQLGDNLTNIRHASHRSAPIEFALEFTILEEEQATLFKIAGLDQKNQAFQQPFKDHGFGSRVIYECIITDIVSERLYTPAPCEGGRLLLAERNRNSSGTYVATVNDVAGMIHNTQNPTHLPYHRSDERSVGERLLLPEKWWRPHTSALPGRMMGTISEYLGLRIQFLEPTRNPDQQSGSSETPELSYDAKNLPGRLLTISANRKTDFEAITREIQSLVPGILSMETPLRGGGVLAALAEEHLPSPIDITFAGHGVRNLLAIATMLQSVVEGSLLIIDEPENHLHPGAQRKLMDYLLSKSIDRRIILATHSPSMIGVCPTSKVVVVAKENGATKLFPLTPDKIEDLIGELGIALQDTLQIQAILLVEGRSDKAVFKALAKRFCPNLKLMVMEIDGDGNLQNVADSKLFPLAAKSGLPVWCVLDRDSTAVMPSIDGASPTLKRLTRTQTEDYLLNPIALAATLSPEREQIKFAQEMATRIPTFTRGAKHAVRKLAKEYGNNDTSDFYYSLASNIPEDDEGLSELRALVMEINTSVPSNR